MSRTVFRVFLSSTFGDFQLEREALRARVWPELERLCAAQDASFQVIDLRWGIAESAALSHDTVRICLDEVRRCQRLSPKPNFVILGGDRYGWRPTPTTIISVEEFTAILGQCRSDRAATALLNRWYRLDRNAVPNVYTLQPRTGEFLNGVEWATEEQKLLAVLRSAACDLGLTPARRELYFLSATHLEIVHGLLRQNEACGHVFAYQRSISGLPKQAPQGIARRFSDYLPNGTSDPEAAELRKELFDEIVAILPKHHVHRFKARWTGDGAQPLTTDHIDILCAKVRDDLLSVIIPQLAQARDCEPLTLELEGQVQFQQDETRLLVGRDREVRTITAYAAKDLTTGKPKPPLLVSGHGGSGKSALMARIVDELKKAHPEALLISRFIGVTPRSWEPVSFVEDLLSELCRGYGEEPPPLPEEGGFKAFAELVADNFALASTDRPLLLVIDAVDQFGGTVRPADLFPAELPPHVSLILSVLAGRDCESLVRHYPKASLLSLQPLGAKAGATMLDGLLARDDRTLRPAQRKALLQHAHGLPLYVALVAPLARRLTDRDIPSELPETVTELAAYVIDRIAAHHGEAITRAALHYLKVSRYGLSEEELQSVLWRDPEVRAEFERRRNPDQPTVDALPPVFWARLYGELDPYINEVWMDSQLLHRFFHRVFGEVAGRMDDNHRCTLHSRLADFFLDQPLYLDDLPDVDLTPTFAGQVRTPNGRKLMELPYHLTHAGRTEEAIAVATDFDFAMAKCRLNRSEDWADDFVRIRTYSISQEQKRDWRIWESFVRSNRHILLRGDAEWPAHKILLQLAIEHADDSPVTLGAQKFLEDGRCDWEWLRRELRAKRSDVSPCLAVLEGHEGHVNGAQFLPDGRILSWSADNNLRIWDGMNGNCLAVLTGHTDSVISAQLLPYGRILSWSDDNTLRVWDGERGSSLAVLQGDSIRVNNVLLLSSGRILTWYRDKSNVTLGDKTLRVWDEESGACISGLEGHDEAVRGALQVSDGKILSWAQDKTLRLWSEENGTCLAILEGHIQPVRQAILLPGKRILSWSGDDTLRLWESEGGRSLAVLEGHTDCINGVLMLPDGRLLSWSDDKTLRVWDLERGACLFVLEGHADWVEGAQLLTSGKILSWSSAGDIRTWDIESGICLVIMEGHSNTVTNVLQLPGGRIVSWALKMDTSLLSDLRLWDGDSGICLAVHTMSVYGALPLPSGDILSWGDSKKLLVWDGKNGTYLGALMGHTGEVSGSMLLQDGRLMTWSTDETIRLWVWEDCCSELEKHPSYFHGPLLFPNEMVVSWSDDEVLRLWNAENGICLSVLEGHTDSVVGVDFLCDGRLLSWSTDGTLRIWNWKKNVCLAVLKGHSDSIIGVLLLDGGRILSWSSDKTLRLWDDDSGACLAVLEGHKDTVLGALELPNGSVVSWSFGDKELRLWDVKTCACLTVLEGHTDWAEGAMLLPGDRLLSWSDDQTLRLWNSENGVCLASMRAGGDVLNVSILPSGQLVSISADVRIWTSEGELVKIYNEYSLDIPPDEVLSVLLSFETGDDISANKNGLFSSWNGRTIIVEDSNSIMRWQGKSKYKANKLLNNKRYVVKSADLGVCVIKKYLGENYVQF